MVSLSDFYINIFFPQLAHNQDAIVRPFTQLSIVYIAQEFKGTVSPEALDIYVYNFLAQL
jgi:hypothetical protein